MDKYYTPEIEEFHVGFEYEFRHDDFKEDGWIKYSTPEFNPEREDSFIGKSDLSEYRVKYLDREDIESLEFIFNGNERGKFRFIRGNIVIIFCPDTYIVQIIIEPIERRFNYVIPRGFCGTIKNISELKQIIKMLKLGQYWM